MMKRIILSFGLFALIAFSVGCTSSSEQQDEAVVEGEATSTGDGDFFAEEEADSDAGAKDSSDITSEETGLEEFDDSGDDLLADLGEDPPVVDSTEAPTGEGDAAVTGDPTLADPLADGGVPLDEGVGDLQPDETAGLDYAEGGDSSAGSEEPSYAEPKTWIEVKKIKETPYQKAGQNVNAVYIAREGDTLTSVANKVGVSDPAVLGRINTTLKENLKVGDKVYYQSAQRPDDATRLLTYYEDIGLAPETYVSQSGDNIRIVSKNLLGHADSWKEIWATNMGVDSKGDISEGIQLRYWRGTDGAALPPVAAIAPQPEEGNSLDTPNIPPPQNTAANTPPPPLDEDFPPQPSDASLEEDFPPPPSAATIEPPPPPPPPPPRAQPKADDPFAIGGDPNQTMALAVGAILLLAALLLFIVIRKKKSRKNMEFSTSTSTQIE